MKHNLCLLWNVFLGLIFVASEGQAARASSLIHAKAKAAAAATVAPNVTISQDEVSASPAPTGELAAVNVTAPTNVTKLTGVPQIDYLLDPNLPRELNGLNLTEYPFYNSIPEEIDFKCDGLHDGFYASVTHKCQVYHHCLFGTRYDFLCANYTAFDQRTFICHFASEVDCKNSPKFYKRNEALYKAASTTTLAPPPTSSRPQQSDGGGRRRRPSRRRKPAYDYYDDYSDYPEDYEDGEDRRGKRPRPQSKDSEASEYEEALPTAPNKALYDRPRVAPKIRRPVPLNERDKYDYSGDARVIPTKASSGEDSSFEEEEKTDSSKRKNKPRLQDTPAESGKGKDRDRDRYRDRGGDRDRYRGRDEDLEPERERDRAPVRDDEERERVRERDRIRDDDRDLDRDRPRNRRPAKKRKRPDPYDYYDDDYEVRRPKPRDRIRYDDEDEEEYEDRYYRKPLRSRDRVRDRDRDRERERDRYRPKEEEDRRSKPKVVEYEKPIRHREYSEEEDDRIKGSEERPERGRDKYEGSRGKGYKDSGKRLGDEEDEEEERYTPRKQHESSASSVRGSIEPTPKSGRDGSKKPPVSSSDEDIKSDSRFAADDEELSEEKVKPPAEKPVNVENTGEGGRPRQNYFPRGRSTTVKPVTKPEILPDEKPLPAPRPAYITPPQQKVTKKQPEISSRKPAGFRRPTTQRYSEEEEEESEKEEELPEKSPITGTRSHFKRKGQRTEEPHPFTAKSTPEPAMEEKATPKEKDTKLKVPYEEPVDEEELAPRAPKGPVMSNRRRPFLPSRGGDPTLLRGLTPVGAKAFTAPKKEEERKPQELPAPASRERFSPRPAPFDPNKYPTGIEFRARVTANLGVEQQPRLTPSFQEDSAPQEEDYSGEVVYSEEMEKEEEMKNFETQKSAPQTKKYVKQDVAYNNPRGSVVPSEKAPLPLRPTLRPTDFPQLSLADVHTGIEEHTQVKASEESKERKYSSRVPTFDNKPALANVQYLSERPQQKQPSYQQLGPQTFFSENPKFQTTVLNEPPRPRPTSSITNYNQGTHTPAFYQPVIKPGQGQVQVVHFQKTSPIEYSNTPNRRPAIKFPQPENLEDTDEYDVSINDALQPISSLHPRNAQTGVVGSQRTSGSAPVRRRLLPASPTQQSFHLPDQVPTNQKTGQRYAASIVQPQFAAAPSASPVLRSFHSDYYPTYAK